MARKLNIPKSKQIQGLRKAIANRKTPRQFIPSMKKRLAKLTGAAILLLTSILYPLSSSHAQTPVIIQPTQQTLAAAGTACTGSAQNFAVNNRNQTQHYATAAVTGAVQFSAEIDGLDTAGNVFRLSDPLEAASTNLPLVMTGSGYYPQIRVTVTCSPNTATFALSYSGAQATSNSDTGSYLLGQVDKNLVTGGAANTNVTIASFQTPFASSHGVLLFAVGAASAGGATITLNCIGNSFSALHTLIFTLATSVGTQVFPVPDNACPNMQVTYGSGGASAAIYNLEYLFYQPGFAPAATATNLTAAFNIIPALTEKGARWQVNNSISSAGATAATASKAANANGRHVADCISFSAQATNAPAASQTNINLRDGASGAGTVIWTQTILIPATAAQHILIGPLCGLNLIGTPNTAMTLEFSSSAPANESEAVDLSGYDVQ
jgi:hypothetical protein